MKALAAALISIFAMTGPGVAYAQGPSAAEQSFREGREAMLSGDYAGAERAFEASLRAEVSAAALLNLAVSEERLGDLVSARSHLEQMLGLLDANDERYAVGLRLKEALDQRIPTAVAPAPAVTPEHDKTVETPPPQPTQHARATARTANDTSVVVDSRPVATYVLAGLGVSAIGVSVGTGIVALDKKNAALAECPSKSCSERGLGFAADARRYAAISTVSLAAGVVSLGVASWLFFTHRPTPASRSLAVDVSFSGEQSHVLVTGAF